VLWFTVAALYLHSLAVLICMQLVGGIHGNEQACPELLLRLVNHLVSGYGSNSRITRLLDSTDVYVLPVSEC
jgi:succinylglutamate desuccinylase